jgi:hypothetical protein
LKPVEMAKKGDYFSISVLEKVHRNDKIYKWIDSPVSLKK